jgi:ElaB/YqjD/DUF883 family membrane-anchored ribosome-binding protein
MQSAKEKQINATGGPIPTRCNPIICLCASLMARELRISLHSNPQPPHIMVTEPLPETERHHFTDAAHRAADSVIDAADRITHQAADATMDRVVRPAVNATRDAAVAVGARADQTNRFLTDTLRNIEEDVHRNPVRSLGYAVGVGFLLGLWFRWK